MNEMVQDRKALRRARRRAERTKLRIEDFRKRFAAYGDAHLFLAFHAAFPLVLTPDLVYRIWVNFDRDEDDRLLDVPWIATADLLLSDLCEEVGYELYEMHDGVREALLRQFNEDQRFGGDQNGGQTPRLDDLAQFLEEYSEHLREDTADPNAKALADVHYWTALSHSDPDEAVKEMMKSLKTGVQAGNRAEMLRMTGLASELGTVQDRHQPLLIYLRGVEEYALGNGAQATTQLADVDLDHFETLGIELVMPEIRAPEIEEEPESESEPAVKKKRVLGVDIAPQYVRDFDFQKAVEAGVAFCFIRAGSGLMKDDEFYRTAYEEAGKAGMQRGIYFTIHPESETNAAGMEAQAGYFNSLLMDDAELGAIVDVEIDGVTPDAVKRFVDAFQEIEPYSRPVMIYTAAWFWNKERGFDGEAVAWAAEHPLWVAHHSDEKEPIEPGDEFEVILPKPWSGYAFHQWTANGGSLAGQEQRNLDLSHFSGSLEELKEWARQVEYIRPIGIKYVTAESGLNMRSGPGTEFGVLKQVARGTAVELIEEGGWDHIRLENQTGYALSTYLSDERPVGEEAQQDGTTGVRYVTAGLLNMRSGPGTQFDVQMVLTRGTSVQVIESGEWTQIQVNVVQGYVAGAYLAERPPPDVPLGPDVAELKLSARDSRALSRAMAEGLDEGELRGLTILMEVDYDDLAGSGVNRKAQELIEHSRRRALTAELLRSLTLLKPETDWYAAAGIQLDREQQEALREAQAFGAVGVKFVTAQSGLNVRSGPGTQFDVLKRLTVGTEVAIIEEGEWDFVQAEGETGYADSEYLVEEWPGETPDEEPLIEEAPPAVEWVQGFDVAPTYLREADFQMLADAEAKFCFIRAGNGQMKDDEGYRNSFNWAGEAGLLRGLYFVIYPEGAENAGTMEAQAGYFASLLMGDAELGAVADVDQDGLTPNQVKRFVDEFQKIDSYGRPIMIRTSAQFWSKARGFSGPEVKWAAEYPLWVVHHSIDKEAQEPGPEFQVMLPEPWEEYAFHQWMVAGPELAGLEASDLYMDYFNGSLEQLRARARDLEPVTPIGIKYVTAVGGINMRAGPGTEFSVVQQLAHNSEVKIIDEGLWDHVLTAGETGYVLSEYLAEIRPEPESAPNSRSQKGIELQQFALQDRSEFQSRRRIWFQFHYNNLLGRDIKYGGMGMAVHRWTGQEWEFFHYKHSYGGPSGTLRPAGGPGGGPFHDDNWKADRAGIYALTPFLSFDSGAIEKQNRPDQIEDGYHMSDPFYVRIGTQDDPGSIINDPPAPLPIRQLVDTVARIVLDVPYRSSLDEDGAAFGDGGAAALTMLLNTAGVAIEMAGVTGQFPSGSQEEFLSSGRLIEVAKRNGIEATFSDEGGEAEAMARLRSTIEAGKPFIAPVNYGRWRDLTGSDFNLGRFVLVVGFDEQAVYVHDPSLGTAGSPDGGAYLRVPTDLFLAAWGGFAPSINPNWAGIYPAESIAASLDPDGEVLSSALDASRAHHYERVIAAVAGQTDVSEEQLRDWFERQLITEDGTRALVYREEKEAAGLPNEAVERLVRSYLLRTETRAGEQWLELADDHFVDPILRSNQTWGEARLAQIIPPTEDDRDPEELRALAEEYERQGEPLKAAELWQQAGDQERAAEQYEAGGGWLEAAKIWRELFRYNRRAQAYEKYAQEISGQGVDDEEKANAWEAAARSYQETTLREDRLRSEREVARYRKQPILEIAIEYDDLVIDWWSVITYTVRNIGFGPARQMVIHVRQKEFEAASDSSVVQPMLQSDGQPYTRSLQVRPRLTGDGVPLKFVVEYRDVRSQDHRIERTFTVPVFAQGDARTDFGISSQRLSATERKRYLALSRVLATRFSMEELGELLFGLRINPDDVEGNTVATKARELVNYCLRSERIGDLLEEGARQRPDIDWDSFHRA